MKVYQIEENRGPKKLTGFSFTEESRHVYTELKEIKFSTKGVMLYNLYIYIKKYSPTSSSCSHSRVLFYEFWNLWASLKF